MASCTEDFKDWADPMSNSENPASAGAVVAAAPAIDFTTITTDSVQLFVPTYTVEEGTTAANTVTLYKDETKNEGISVNVDDQGRAKTTELRDALEALFGVPAEAIDVPINVITVLTKNGQAFRFESDEILQDPLTINAKMAAGMYLVEGENKTAMEFVEPGKYTLTVPAAERTFYFLPFVDMNNNNADAGKLGANEEPDGFIFGGKLAKGAQAHDIYLMLDEDYTQYIITVNTNDMTYDVEGLAYAEMIWMAGNTNGWGTPVGSGLKNKGWKGARNNDGDYYGFMYLNGDFKFRSGKDNWNAPDWGLLESIDDYSGYLAAQAGNINAPEGFYMVEANLDAMTYKLTPITTIGVIGGFNGWASDYAKLTYNTATGAWEGTCEIPAGTEFKFRANESWDINWGGDINNLGYDGGNLKFDVDGNYFIQLYLTYEGDFHAIFTPAL